MNRIIECNHYVKIVEDIEPTTPDGCEECLAQKLYWISLRKCLVCGHVGCDKFSIGKHADKHHAQTGHEIIEMYPDKTWRWCYEDEVYLL